MDASHNPPPGERQAAPRRLLVCPFVSDEAGEESVFPQMSRPSSDLAFKTVYWQCMAVLFASFRRFDTSTDCKILTNADPGRYCEPEVLRTLARLGVAIEILPFDRSATPRGERFGNVLYMLDAMAALHRQGEHDQMMVVDPDIVFLADPEPVWQSLESLGLAYYDVGPSGGPIAGLSLDDLRAFAERKNLRLRSDMRHAGGEFLAADRASLDRLIEAVSIIRAADLGGMLTVEEQILSIAIAMLGLGGNNLNQHVRRIWTGPRRRDAQPSDLGLLLWHVPREKEFGFITLYQGLAKGWTSLPAEEYARHIARSLGVPRWPVGKWMTETPRLMARQIRKRAMARG